MPNDSINRSTVVVDFKDVLGNTITDKVEIKIYNMQLQSLKNSYSVQFKGTPASLPDVPAFPTGHGKMIVEPTKYRWKQRFINVQVDEKENKFTEYFFVEPDRANPHPIGYKDLTAKSYGEQLLRILQASSIGAAAWDKLNKKNRATILNLCAKMSKETTKKGEKLITFVERIDRQWLDDKHVERIYAHVKKELLTALRGHPQVYSSVDGGLHKFPDGWASVKGPDSFKTLKDSAGNIQFTFAENSSEQSYLADIDLDDHKGLAHVADVLKHKFSAKNTNPYDIHQTLLWAQGLDPEYKLL